MSSTLTVTSFCFCVQWAQLRLIQGQTSLLSAFSILRNGQCGKRRQRTVVGPTGKITIRSSHSGEGQRWYPRESHSVWSLLKCLQLPRSVCGGIRVDKVLQRANTPHRQPNTHSLTLASSLSLYRCSCLCISLCGIIYSMLRTQAISTKKKKEKGIEN